MIYLRFQDALKDTRGKRRTRIQQLFSRSFLRLCEGIEKFIIAAQANEKFVLLSVDISGKMKGRFTVSRRGTVFECIWIIQPGRRGRGEGRDNNRFSGRFIASDRTSLATAPLYKTLLNTARRKSPIISTQNQL